MKVLNNSLKLKDLSKNHFLLIVVVIIVAAVLSFQKVNHIQQQPKDANDVLQKQRFVFVQDAYDLKEGSYAGIGFDLKEKNLFVNASTVLKDNKLYGRSGKFNKKEFYEHALNGEITSILSKIKLTPSDIKNSNYMVICSPKSFVNKAYFKEKYPPELEKKYLNKELQFSKIRITYNKEFLPTKIDWYYKGTEGLKWYTWRTYSYPFKNKAEFDKKLDEQIQLIKDKEREYEAEAEDG